MDNMEFISKDEFSRFKRFHSEQFKLVGIQLIEMKKKLDNLIPHNQVAPRTKELLTNQVDKMFREIKFLQSKLIEMEKKVSPISSVKKEVNNG